MKRWITGLLMVACTATVMAQNIDQGTKELRLDGSIDFDTGAGEEIVLDVGLGHFVVDNVELGGVVGVANNDLITVWRLGGFGELSFPMQDAPLVPFVGAGLAWAYADPDIGDSEDAMVLGLAAGVKYFLTDDVAISTQVNFEYASEDIFLEDDDISDTNWDITLGLRYFFDWPAAN